MKRKELLKEIILWVTMFCEIFMVSSLLSFIIPPPLNAMLSGIITIGFEYFKEHINKKGIIRKSKDLKEHFIEALGEPSDAGICPSQLGLREFSQLECIRSGNCQGCWRKALENINITEKETSDGE